jgi:hypothetical protein
VKAADANSELALSNAADWFRNTAMSRLDDPASSLIIVTMQRLHAKDLSGILIEAGWPSLVLPAIATGTADYCISEDEVYHRPVGELLQPNRDSIENIKSLQQLVGKPGLCRPISAEPTTARGQSHQGELSGPPLRFLR